MKFVSKLPNYRVVLKQGLPGNRQLGTASTSMVSVRFENGMAEVRDKELIELMLKHPNCGKRGEMGTDFMPIEEDESDPYENKRPEVEPVHTMTNIEYGHVGKSINVKKPATLSAEQMDMVKELATKMAMEIIAKTNSSVGNSSSSENSYSTLPPDKKIVFDRKVSAPLDDFSKLATEPLEDDKGIIYEDSEPDPAPVIERVEGKIGGVEIGGQKVEEVELEDAGGEVKEEGTSLNSENIKPRRGRPATKK